MSKGYNIEIDIVPIASIEENVSLLVSNYNYRCNKYTGKQYLMLLTVYMLINAFIENYKDPSTKYLNIVLKNIAFFILVYNLLTLLYKKLVKNFIFKNYSLYL